MGHLIKRFIKYGKVNESLGEDYSDRFQSNENMKIELFDKIQDSVNSFDMNLIEEFIDSYLTDPDVTLIEGLINDSDIYDFYLKYINEVDEILANEDYFENTPLSVGALGLYNFMIAGTKEAIRLIIEEIKKEVFE